MNTDSEGRTTRVQITPSLSSNPCVLCALCGWRSPLCETLRSSASLRFSSYLCSSASICGCISTKKEAALADGFCEVSPRLLVATAERYQRRQTQTCQRERRRFRNQIQVEALHAEQKRRSSRATDRAGTKPAGFASRDQTRFPGRQIQSPGRNYTEGVVPSNHLDRKGSSVGCDVSGRSCHGALDPAGSSTRAECGDRRLRHQTG